ncbi:hypothetical protein KR067_002634, partial [Drosophila pandora]
MESTCGIFDLPLEVLLMVFKEVKAEKDKLNLAQAHKVFGTAFAMDAGTTYRKIMFDERPIQEWKIILPLCGASVLRIVTKNVRTTVKVTKLASEFCPNLEEFFIPVRSHFWNHVTPVLSTMKRLKWIGLTNNYERVKVVKTLRLLPNLRFLDLAKFALPDMLALKELTDLESISVVNGRKESVDLYQMCSGMKNLNGIDMRFVDIRIPKEEQDTAVWPKMGLIRIGYGKFHTQMPFMPVLKYLTIESTHPTMKLNHILGTSVVKYENSLEYLRFCPETDRILDKAEAVVLCHLKALKVLECRLENDETIGSYIIQLKKLEQLNLRYSTKVTNYGVLLLLKHCKRLRKLNLFGCTYINRNLLGPATHILLRNGVRPENPLVVEVGREF